MLKLSQFTVVRNLGDRALPSHALVFNTFSGRSLTVRQVDWDVILAALEAPDATSESVGRSLEQLRKLGILVGAEVDERSRWRVAFDTVRWSPKRIFPLLAVTTACNIGCTYCYESGTRGETMTPEVVAGVLRWFERRITVDGIREIYPTLFGGEPLLFPDRLFALMDGLRALCATHGAGYEFSMSTNGVLLTTELARSSVERGLQQIQVSLDGPQPIHDVRRIGKRGQPSYSESLRGLKIAAEHIGGVTLKINFDRQNRSAIVRLYEAMVAEGLAGRITVKLESIAHQMPDSKVVHDPSHVMPPDSEELASAYAELSIEAGRHGIAVTKNTAHTTPCMFTSHHGVLLGPDGSIYKCISLVGRKEHRVGTVFDDDYDADRYGQQMNVMKRLDECFAERCQYVPVCGGGCAYESIVRTGRSDLRFCTKKNLEALHYYRQLIDNRENLERLGMRPLTAAELQQVR